MQTQISLRKLANTLLLGLYVLILPIHNDIFTSTKNDPNLSTTGEVLAEFAQITNTVSPSITPNITVPISPTVISTSTPTPTSISTTIPTNITNTPIPPTSIPLPTATTIPSSCPVTTQNCIPCNAGELYCRYLPGESTGYLGWACQNNNPGNIRPATFKNDIITNNGGTAPCGDKGGYMVFKTYSDGFNGLKSYLKGISYGQHSAYTECVTNGDCTLIEFFSHYAPAGDQNDPDSYANNVANRIGVDANSTTLRWVVDNKLTEMANAIQIHEGWFAD